MSSVECHVHLWAGGQPSPAHRQVPALAAATLLAEMDAAGVDAAVIQPPAWDATSNEVAVAAAAAYPERYAVLGWFPLNQTDNQSQVARWTERPGMLGLRFTFSQPHEKTWPTDGSLDGLWEAAAAAQLPVALACSDFLPTVGMIAQRHPRLRLLVDHLGAPLRSTGAAAYARIDELIALARYPNIAVKASAAPGYSGEAYPFTDIHPYLQRVFDAFGAQRMFWGTDITRMPCTWRQCVSLFTEELPWLRGSDLDLVMGEALCQWIGWQRGVAASGISRG